MEEEPKVRRCAIYARVSTDLGLGQEYNSITAQIDCCSHYIEMHAGEGWQLSEVYKDEGISGGTTERPALQAMLRAVEAGKLDHIVVYKLDRLSRNLLDFLTMQQSFEAHKCSLASATEMLDTSTSIGRAMLHILGVFAQMERERIRERIRDKLRATRQAGLWGGGLPPYGYKCNEQRLEVVEEAAAIVRRVFAMRKDGIMPREIAATLNEDGVQYVSTLTKAARRWQTPQIVKMLTHPVYAGYVPYHDQLFEGKHTAIISRKTWEKVQKSMKENAVTRTKETNSAVPFPLRDLLKCGKCGSVMTTSYTVKNGKMHRYYTCRNKSANGKRECDCDNLSADAVEDFAKCELKALADDNDLAAALILNMPEWNAKLVGDCVFNIEKLLETLTSEELAAVFHAAFKSITFDPTEPAFIIKKAS